MPGNCSATDPLPLYYREYGHPDSLSPPVVLIHGLFGSGTNWHSLATRLLQLMAENRRILVPDLRNHGQSPHHGTMTYEAMAADLAALLDRLGIAQADLVGHSLGGKAAMMLALQWPHRVRTLVVEDIAPVTYSVRFQAVFAAMHELDLGDLTSRKDAERRLAERIPNPTMRELILQNLRKTEPDGSGASTWPPSPGPWRACAVFPIAGATTATGQHTSSTASTRTTFPGVSYPRCLPFSPRHRSGPSPTPDTGYTLTN